MVFEKSIVGFCADLQYLMVMLSALFLFIGFIVNPLVLAGEPVVLPTAPPDCHDVNGSSSPAGRRIVNICISNIENPSRSDEGVKSVEFKFSDGTFRKYAFNIYVPDQDRSHYCGFGVERAVIYGEGTTDGIQVGVMFNVYTKFSYGEVVQRLRWLGRAPTGEEFSLTLIKNPESDALTLFQLEKKSHDCKSQP